MLILRGGSVMKNSECEDFFYEELCSKYYEPIQFYCRRLVKNQNSLRDFIEECTQETFLEAKKKMPQLKSHPNIEGWLHVTARNQVNLAFRTLYTQRKYETYIDLNQSQRSYMCCDLNLEKILDADINYEKVKEDLLNHLSDTEYNLYEEYFNQHLTVSELAAKYVISESAVTTRIFRTRKKIKAIIHQYFHEHD